MFSDCDTTFPVLEDLTLGCSLYMPDRIKISSRSLKDICLFGLKKLVDITIDAETLVCIRYKDHLIRNFLNSNIPNVQRSSIEFNTHTNQSLLILSNILKFRNWLVCFKLSSLLILSCSKLNQTRYGSKTCGFICLFIWF